MRVLTAQTQLSKRVLFVLPIALFLLLNLINPGYMAPLYQTATGRSMLGLAVVGVLIGVWLMNRLAVLRY